MNLLTWAVVDLLKPVGIFEMAVVSWVFVALAHFYCAHGYQLHNPIALRVLKQDLQILAEQFPSADQWPLSKIIKYNDKIQFVVNYAQNRAKGAGQQTFVMVIGELSVATYKRSSFDGHELASIKQVRKLFVDKNNVYFDDPWQPQQNLQDYYIVAYYHEYPQRKLDYKPVIEYMAENQFERELTDHIPRIRYESSLSKSPCIKTYIRLKNGQKVQVRYHHNFNVAVLEADFYCLFKNDERDLIEKSIHFKKLSYDFEKQSISEHLKAGYIYAVRVVPYPSRPVSSPTGSFKMVRDVLLKDLWDSASMYTTRTSDVIGVIKYDNDKIVTLSYTSTDQNSPLALNGRFLTSDGISFSRLCIASSANQIDEESVSQLRSSNSSSEKQVFFSCPENGKDSLILLQEDADFIEIASGKSQTTEDIEKLPSVESFIVYIPYWQFHRTIEILTSIMTVKCAESLTESYRLFVDVFVNYNCNTKVASFETLNLWFQPGRDVSMIETMRGVSYDSNSKRFNHEGIVISGFKLRQLYPGLQNGIPAALRFVGYSGINNIAFDLKSVELDLYNIRENLLRNILPMWGVVHIDDSVLFIAEKSKRTIDGVNKWTIVVKCNVPKSDSCSQRECMEEDLVIYDGTNIVVTNSQELNVYQLPAKVYWPERQKLPLLNNAFSVGYRVHYIKLTTFKSDMKELSNILLGHCDTLNRNRSGAKLILHIYYPHNKGPIVGYYGCTLNYIFFATNFQIIKLSAMHGKENTARTASSDGSSPFSMKSERVKDFQSKYVLEDLLYDQVGDAWYSKSMLLTEVYALRQLSTKIKVTLQKGTHVKLVLRDGLNVHVF